MTFRTLSGQFPMLNVARALLLCTLLSGLTGCGGGASGAAPMVETSGPVADSSLPAARTGSQTSPVISAVPTVTIVGVSQTVPTPGPSSRQEATRFLTQATFGPTDADVSHLLAVGYAKWFDEQFAAPVSQSLVGYLNMRAAAGSGIGPSEITMGFWKNALTGQDQLRQRLAFALSEIFVASMNSGCAADPWPAASYMDMLSTQAFDKFRGILEGVARHPYMGCYLTFVHNLKEDPNSGRIPDENFSREVMQLFTIGVEELNQNGTPKLGADGNPIATYGPADVSGLAKVFTGWSWQCVDNTNYGCLFNASDNSGRYAQPQLANWNILPMMGYPMVHSVSEKRFLGFSIPRQDKPDPQASLAAALDFLSTHPNVAPFISKQLIQRFVTSNPSSGYVQRVASRFSASSGDLKAVLKAILLDPEARDVKALDNANFGKVREPVLRLSALLRAFPVKSQTGWYMIALTDTSGSLYQSPMYSPSVFNFFRPGYSPAGTRTGAAGLRAPEMQLVNETSVAGYVSFMDLVLERGAGWFPPTGNRPDVQFLFTDDASAAERTAALDPPKLVELINQRLFYGTMSAALKAEITAAVSEIDLRTALISSPQQTADTTLARVRAALLLAVASPEFQVQR